MGDFGKGGDINGGDIRVNRLLRVKVQFTLDQATKAQRGSRGITLLFL
jgi:hypothetical protein